MESNKYLITWNCGYGESNDVAVANSQEDANDIAYEMWREEAENSATYKAEVLTKDLAEEYGFEDEL